ncbi:MAG: YihY/virulence factor BrkB family protein [Cryomorphaceae bacterium]
MTDNKERFSIRHLPALLKETYRGWNEEDPFRQSAVVAYYAILSLPGLMVLIIWGVGAIWGREIVSGRLNNEIQAALGKDAAQAVQEMVTNSTMDEQSWWAMLLGIGVLIYGATGVFYQLQMTLNRFWNVKPDPKAGIKKLLLDRAQSFAFILVIAFLLLISMVISAGLNVMEDYLERIFSHLTVSILYVANIALALGIITCLFAMMFKFLPDAKIEWKSVWVGALITAILFTIGEFLLGVYFGASNPGSTYGAAGSVILILLWVSYSSLILFFGAKFTYVYANRYEGNSEPLTNAVRVED